MGFILKTMGSTGEFKQKDEATYQKDHWWTVAWGEDETRSRRSGHWLMVVAGTGWRRWQRYGDMGGFKRHFGSKLYRI